MSTRSKLYKGGPPTGTPLSADDRIGNYTRQSGQGQNPRDLDGYPETARGQRMTGPQRRRAVHKSGGNYGPGGPAYGSPTQEDRENLTDPDRWTGGKKGKRTYLNPDQFHTMKDIRGYGALDGAHGQTVNELIPIKQREVAIGRGDTADYDALADTMRRGGPAGGKVPPILLQPNNSGGDSQYQVGNGGHRIAIAHDLGWKAMPVTTKRSSSGYGDDRFQRNSSNGDSYDSYLDADRSGSYGRAGHHGGYSASGWVNTSDAPMASSSASPAVHGRSHIPGATGASANNKGQRWHAGKATGEPGLYTQLHGPGPEAVDAGPFGGNTAAARLNQGIQDRHAQARAGQGTLPGMRVTWNAGRSANARNDPDNGPLGGQWSGGKATGAAPGAGARPKQAGPRNYTPVKARPLSGLTGNPWR